MRRMNTLRRHIAVNDLFHQTDYLCSFIPKHIAAAFKQGETVRHKSRNARHLANKIFNEFLRLSSDDMVDNNTKLIIPNQNQGMMYITVLKDSMKKLDLHSNFHSDGKIYQCRWRMKIRGMFVNIRARFNLSLRMRMCEKITDGYHYWQQ